MEITKIKDLLKTEFYGLDDVIDKLVDSVKMYYDSRDYLKRPIILNLWGLTGYGKTTVIKRVMELFDLAYTYKKVDNMLGKVKENDYRVDVSEFNSYILGGSISGNSKQHVFIHDEFHLMSDFDGLGDKKEPDRSVSYLWELMDDGIIRYTSSESASGLGECMRLGLKLLKEQHELYSEGYEAISDYPGGFHMPNLRLRYLHDVIGGEYTLFSSETLFKSKSKYDHDDDADIKYFCFTDEVLSAAIIPYYRTTYKHMDRVDVLQQLGRDISTFDKLIAILEKAYEFIKNGINLDYSQSLIINIGNLDSLYPMHGDVSSELDGDDYIDILGDITNSDIKESLSELFRQEHIGRLGEVHIAFPIYSSNTFKEIIRKKFEVENVLHSITKELKIDESLIDFIHNKKISVSLGVRPIQTVVDSIISLIYSMVYGSKETFSEVLKVSYDYGTDEIVLNESLRRKMLDKKEYPSDVRQRIITSVHEIGHALAYMVLFDKKPSKICVDTSDSGLAGFVLVKTKGDDTFKNKNSIRARAVVNLGGYLCEKLVFGDDHITTGSSSDLAKLTSMMMRAAKLEGLFTPNSPAIYGGFNSKEEFAIRSENKIDGIVYSLIREYTSYGSLFFNEMSPLLYKWAEFVNEKKSMSIDDIEKMYKEVRTFANQKISIRDNYLDKGIYDYLSKFNEKKLIVNKQI